MKMNVAGCILILTFSFHLDLVELSSPGDSSRRSRSRSPHRSQNSSSQSSRLNDQSTLTSSRSRENDWFASSPENNEFLTVHDVGSLLDDLGPPEHSHGAYFGHASRPHNTVVATGSNALSRGNPLDPCYMPGCTGDIYLQGPANRVLRGTLSLEWYRNGVPSWMKLKTGYERNDPKNRVFLHKPGWNSTFLKSDIRVNVHTPHDINIRNYKCFVKTEDGLYTADLVRLRAGERIDLNLITTTTIYVLMPEDKQIYWGNLKPLSTHLAPRWIDL